MDRFLIDGGWPLHGDVAISGSKNATLPLMAAALLADGVTTVEGTPDLQDITTMAMVLKVLGADVFADAGRLRIDTTHLSNVEAPYELVRKMRASFYVLGPLVARFGRARVSLPGGCALGPRPVDLHLRALQKLGCRIELDGGYVVAGTDGLVGAKIMLDLASVGATGNIMMAATAAKGTTVIDNAACEPEIVDLADMLNAMGAGVSGAGTRRIEIEGRRPLSPVNWRVIPDRIEAGTYLIAAAGTGGGVNIRDCRPDHLTLLLDKLTDSGFEIEQSPITREGEGKENGDALTITPRSERPRAVDITTAVYPGFPTDLQAPWTSLMALAEGDAVITDTIYPERFNHIPELQRLGAQIRKDLNSIHIRGVERLKGAPLMCSDIRAGAGLVAAALAAEGESTVLRVYHLDRGYEALDGKFAKLGGRIRRVRE
ncbi:MAG: UDP-N-acetylglucosamine 1-carboxyvinyltransferase [Calditrichaeota bacterium]|nr:UDP-N-acetylglucosamine 1-carboxyvinyltransferase [Calditrichota bacterium]